MPITFSIDVPGRPNRVTARGSITLSDVESHLDEEQRLGRLERAELIDARQATAVFTPAEVRRIVDRLRRLAKDFALGPTAVIVADDVSFGMLRMLEILVEDVCLIRPFRDAVAASDWLAQNAPGA